MEDIIEKVVDDMEIAKLAKALEAAKQKGGEEEVTARFQYAYGLLKSAHSQDICHGVNLMENLYYDGDQSARRDYLYYIAVGQTRLKKYNLALDCVEQFLNFEPENPQARKLKAFIKERLTRDGVVGMAVTGGAALVLGGLIGLGLSLARR